MPKIFMVSTEALWDAGAEAPHGGVAASIKKVIAAGNLVALVSIHPEPTWLNKSFPGVVFCPCRYDERKNGKIIDRLLSQNAKIGLKHSDMVVIGAKDSDFFMAVLKQVLFIRCDWAEVEERDRAKNYGIPLSDPALLPYIVGLLESKSSWYFRYESDDLALYALTDASTLGMPQDAPERALVEGMRSCLKQANPRRKLAFQIHLLSSLYMNPDFRAVDVWSYYPGSASKNTGDEVMAGFCDLVRTSYSRRTKGPLFIRHSACQSRHRQTAADDRTDPTEQIRTVHLNPAYRGKLKDKTVAVLDDFLTHGVSLGVAAALLRAAGVKKILCVTMGKFGGQAKAYDISIKSSPFAPITDSELNGYESSIGKHAPEAQREFIEKFKEKAS